MPDFSFTDDTPTPPSPPPKSPDSSETSPATPAKSSGFAFTEPLPTAPATSPVAAPQISAPLAPIPGPPIPKLQPPTAPVAAPKPPSATPAAPIAPRAPVPNVATPIAPGVPVPTVAPPVTSAPIAPKVPVPVVPNPAVPNLNAPAVAAPKAPAPVVSGPPVPQPLQPARPANAAAAGAPAANAVAVPASNAAGRATPIPIAVPMPDASRLDTIEDHVEDGSPHDDFSRKIWLFGQKAKVVLDALEGPASWLLRVTAVIGLCALAYILAATLLGGAGVATNPRMGMLTKNLDLASRAFVLSLLGAAAASLLLGYEDNRLGAIVAVIGVVFHFAMPILLKKSIGNTPAIGIMADHFRFGGYYLVMIGLVKAICDTAIWLWNLPDRMKSRHANVGVSNRAEAKQRIIAREANMMSPCWKLPFCRESIRKQCPAFLAKKTCWKFGRGCYCDTEMISRIVRGESLELISAPTQQSRQGKPPCGRCYIYLEHQTYKFRVMSPLALPVAVLATWLIWPIYTRFFNLGNSLFNSLWASLSFKPPKLTPDAVKTSDDLVAKTQQIGNSPEEIAFIAQNMFGVLLGFMVLIYLSKFIEWAIYKAKW